MVRATPANSRKPCALNAGATAALLAGGSAIQHGHDLLRQGFTVSQVVHDYGNVCHAITELTVESSRRWSETSCGMRSSSPGRKPPSRFGSTPAPSAC
jgi:hypothetical protein